MLKPLLVGANKLGTAIVASAVAIFSSCQRAAFATTALAGSKERVAGVSIRRTPGRFPLVNSMPAASSARCSRSIVDCFASAPFSIRVTVLAVTPAFFSEFPHAPPNGGPSHAKLYRLHWYIVHIEVDMVAFLWQRMCTTYKRSGTRNLQLDTNVTLSTGGRNVS